MLTPEKLVLQKKKFSEKVVYILLSCSIFLLEKFVDRKIYLVQPLIWKLVIDCSLLCFSDIRQVKESRKHFEKISDDMDQALVKNSQAPRTRPQEWEESLNVLQAQKSCFCHTSLDYVFQVTFKVM